MIDVEIMIYSILSSTFNIYNMKKKIDPREIKTFLNESLDFQRINVQQLINFVGTNQTIVTYFLIVGQ